MEIRKSVKAGEPIEVQLCPFGSFYQEDDDGKDVLQVCDRVAFKAISDTFDATGGGIPVTSQILVDIDHAAENGGSTEAAAWITGLRTDDLLGLMGTFDFTEFGAEKVNSKQYRYLSPAWFVDAQGRPRTVTSVALTNKPNILTKPILNRTKVWNVTDQITQETGMKTEKPKDGDVIDPIAAPITPTEGGIDPVSTPAVPVETPPATPDKVADPVETDAKVKNSDADVAVEPTEPVAEVAPVVITDELAVALGLDAGASIEAILGAITVLQATVREYADKELATEADSAMSEYGDAIENREAFKALYVKNRESAKSVLATLRKVQNSAKPAQLNTALGIIEGARKPVDHTAMYNSLRGKDASTYLRQHYADIIK